MRDNHLFRQRPFLIGKVMHNNIKWLLGGHFNNGAGGEYIMAAEVHMFYSKETVGLCTSKNVVLAV